MKKLSKRLKKEWIKALRSGKYIQSKYSLHNGKGFCCLGVLADINEDAYWHPPDYPDTDYWILKSGRKSFNKIYGDHIFGRKTADKLAGMNDNRGKSFSEIADWIEKNL